MGPGAKKNVVIYSGEGVSRHYLTLLSSCLERLGTVKTARQTTELLDLVEAAPSLLVIPGGADLRYIAAFGERVSRVRSAVEEGGSFLGICAGAYFASGTCEFAAGTPFEVRGPRALSLYHGHAVGPVFDGFHPDRRTPGAQRVVRVVWVAESTVTDRPGVVPVGSTFHAHFYGGCAFQCTDRTCTACGGGGMGPGERVLARYADVAGQPPAIIECAVGAGVCILAGVHLEVDPLNNTQPIVNSNGHNPLGSDGSAALRGRTPRQTNGSHYSSFTSGSVPPFTSTVSAVSSTVACTVSGKVQEGGPSSTDRAGRIDGTTTTVLIPTLTVLGAVMARLGVPGEVVRPRL